MLDFRKKLSENKSVLVTVLLMLGIGAISVLTMGRINRIAEQVCWDTLHQTIRDLAHEIENEITGDQQRLAVIAKVVSNHYSEGMDKISQLIGDYGEEFQISQMEILFPGDRVLLEDGSMVSVEGTISFEEELAEGVHVTDIERDITDPDKLVLRNYVPVVKGEETIAMLCAVIDLVTLPEQWSVGVYDDSASLYLIDGNTGDFILDTLHESLGNLEDFGKWDIGFGFNGAHKQEELLAGKNGYIVFYSPTTGEDLYFCYEPTNVNQWRIAISLPESAVFANADLIRDILYTFVAIEILCFLVYLIWILRHTRKETQEKQKRLEMVSYISAVEKNLFAAQNEPERVTDALQNVARMANAQAAFFMLFEEQQNRHVYVWCKDKKKAAMLRKRIGQLAADTKDSLPELTSVCVMDGDGAKVGLLGIWEFSKEEKSMEILENVSLSFGMFYSNQKLFERIRQMGEMDALTGLYNRNSYEKMLSEYQSSHGQSLACIYADANGLHELNNRFGHEAGDKMLQYIAKQLGRAFGNTDLYRVGGDEFVAFVYGQQPESITERIGSIEKALSQQNYHASFGVASEKSIDSKEALDALVKAAETKMYEVKKHYYESTGQECRNRA